MIAAELAATFRNLIDESDPGVDAELVLAPFSVRDAAAVLDAASEHGLKVRIRGGGTHQGMGHRVTADLVLTTRRLNRIVEWSPDDLTVVAQGGVTVADLETQLAERGQSAVLPELPGNATVGGVIAAGVSGWRRLRYGPTRDRMLEVVLATGDGRVVRGGGRVVKNVTGYDLPRLATGSFGSLGVIAQVALKLWPMGRAKATVTVSDTDAALATAFRPLAVVESDGECRVFLSGTRAEVDAQSAAIGGDVAEGWLWPAELAGPIELSLRVPSGLTREAVEQVPAGWHYRAAFGVGEVRLSGDDIPAASAGDLRSWAEGRGGALVVVRAPAEFYEEFDPWGTPPPSVALQRRVKQAFDPLGVCNPGILPGRL